MTATRPTSWTIKGSAGKPIIGDCHRPPPGVEAGGVILIAHGFKGYKDYGMFPRLARQFAAAGFIAHRFNFSHSGMTNNIETFEHPELFEQDTWNKQVHDVHAVISAVNAGTIAGNELPYVLFGHSRGGATALLTAGRMADDVEWPQPAGVATAAAPSRCNYLSPEEEATLLKDGFLISPSSRTGQQLRIGRVWLDEQRAEPNRHDLPRLIATIRCPLLIVHGENDPSVPVDDADRIAEAATSAGEKRLLKIPACDHVFNTPNPMPEGAQSSPQLQQLIDATTDFARDVCGQKARA